MAIIKTKEQARQYAIKLQIWMGLHDLSYGELFKIQNYLTKLGKKFGLISEFKENGLI